MIIVVVHCNSLSLLLQRICDKIYSIQKVHENYGRVFREWGAIDADMAAGLSRASQYMDVSVPPRAIEMLFVVEISLCELRQIHIAHSTSPSIR